MSWFRFNISFSKEYASLHLRPWLQVPWEACISSPHVTGGKSEVQRGEELPSFTLVVEIRRTF